MKKFILMTVGFSKPTPEDMNLWMEWFQSFKDRILDQVGLQNGKEVTPLGVHDIPFEESAITGYLIIEAINIEEALSIAQRCPMVTSTLVYELRTNN